MPECYSDITNMDIRRIRNIKFKERHFHLLPYGKKLQILALTSAIMIVNRGVIGCKNSCNFVSGVHRKLIIKNSDVAASRFLIDITSELCVQFFLSFVYNL